MGKIRFNNEKPQGGQEVDIPDDYKCCTVCMVEFVEPPRILPCGHSFCLACLTQLRGKVKSGVVICPTCRDDKCKVPIEQLIKNFTMMSMIEKSQEHIAKLISEVNEIFQVFLKNLDGHLVTINGLKRYSKVCELKDIIRERYGISNKEQRLLFASKQLEEKENDSPNGRDMLLSDYGIEHGSTVHLVLRLRGGK